MQCNCAGFIPRKDLILNFGVYGYFDESGKFQDHRVISFCGLADDEDQWDRLNEEWVHLLRSNGIASLHMSEGLLNFKRGLSAKSPALGKDARIKVLVKFIRAIKKHIGFAVPVAVDADAFMNLPQHYRDALGQDPHYFAFEAAMAAMVGYLEFDPEGKLTSSAMMKRNTSLNATNCWRDTSGKVLQHANSSLVSVRQTTPGSRNFRRPTCLHISLGVKPLHDSLGYNTTFGNCSRSSTGRTRSND